MAAILGLSSFLVQAACAESAQGQVVEAVPDARREDCRGGEARIDELGILHAQRLDAVATAIGYARAELREIAGQLAITDPLPSRRRVRPAIKPNSTDTLFPI